MARGSCREVQSLLYVALDIGYVSRQQFDCLYESADATAALISRLSTHLRSRERTIRSAARTDTDSGV
jgi:four helix bundle protein